MSAAETNASNSALATPDDAFEQLTKTNSYLPRLELFTGKRNLCADGTIPVNNYGLVKAKNEIVILGKQVIGYLLAYRPRAINFKPKPGPDGKSKVIESSFDEKSDLFKEIQLQAAKKMPEGVLNDCICGIEWLFYHPQYKAITIMCASKSWKAICGSMKVYMDNKKFIRLDSFWKTMGKFSWQAPKVEMLEGGDFTLPGQEALDDMIDTFKNATDFVSDKDLEGDIKVDATGAVPNPDGGGGR